MSATIRVLLADDHTVVRKGIGSLLARHPEIDVVGEAENGWSALELTRKLRPQVVVLDFSMPGLDGAEVARRIAAELPEAKVLMLSCYADETHIRHSLQSGAAGYLIKDCVPDELFGAIRDIAAGKRFMASPQSTARARPIRAEERLAAAPAIALTARQTQVLQLIAEGKANKQIAAALGISIKTVQKHRQEVMNKLHIHNTAGLTRYAVECALVPPAFHTAA